MPGGIGVPELAIILVIIVIIFGVGKLPEIGGALGKGIKEFKNESSSLDDKPIERGTSEPASTLTAQARQRQEEAVTSAGDRRERREVRAEEI